MKPLKTGSVQSRCALEDATQSGKLDAWLKKIDTDIDAGRTKPLDEIINARLIIGSRTARCGKTCVISRVKLIGCGRQNPGPGSLHWKPLVPGLWSVRVGLRYRALARVRGNTAYWFWIGTHNQFDKIMKRFISGA
jgi:hypothetical protein